MTTKDQEFKRAIGSLYKHLVEKLGIKSHPKLVLVEDKNNARKLLAGTGHYDHSNNEICVYVTGRHPKDVMRTFAHEVVHHKQKEQGLLGEKYEDEDQKKDPKYAQNNPHLRKMEKQAYLLGNILFRDWEDGVKYGQSQDNLDVGAGGDISETVLQEDIEIKNRKKLLDAFKTVLSHAVSKGWISSFNRPLTSGQMFPGDFVDDLSSDIIARLEKDISGVGGVNIRGDKYTQPDVER